MFTRRAFAGLAAAGAALSASAARSQETSSSAPKAARRAETDAAKAFTEATHPRGREAAADSEWQAIWRANLAEAETRSDGAYVAGLMRTLSWFDDGHTAVLPFEFVGGVPTQLAGGPFGASLPLKVRPFHDGLWVVAAKDEAAPLLGARIVRVNGVSDVDLMRRHAEHWAGYDPWAHRWSSLIFTSAGLLQGYGVLDDPARPIRIEAAAPDGRQVAAEVRAAPGRAEGLADLKRTKTQPELWGDGQPGGLYVRPLPERRALYVSIDQMEDAEGLKFTDHSRAVFKAMEAPQVERLIIDLRRNGGGNNFLGEPLRKGLERSRFNRPGGLYVLTSPATFSAAQNLADRLERETWAVFGGEPTGGSPNHYGDGKIFKGAATGVSLLCSTIPWFDSYPMDKRTWIAPDLPSPALFADWAAGRDPALELALTHRDPRPLDEFEEARVFYYARPSQKTPWRPFWRAT